MSTIIPSGFYSQGTSTQFEVPDLPTGSLLAYWDAANTASFYPAQSSSFTGSIWYDLSGNGYNLAQNNKPKISYVQDVFNTYPAIYFTASGDFPATSDSAYFTSSTAFVSAFDGSTDLNRNQGYYTASLGFTMFIVSQGGGLIYQMGDTGGIINATKIRMRTAGSNYVGLSATYNGNKTGPCTNEAAFETSSPANTNIWTTNSFFASSSFLDLVGGVYIWTLGQQSFSSTFEGGSNNTFILCGEQTFGSGPFIVGTNWVGTPPSFGGYIQSILIYSRTLSPQERLDVGRFFAYRQYSTNPFQIPT